MNAAPRILFAPACGPAVGGGHVLRDIALAQALRARGADCVFALPAYGAALLSRFGQGCGASHPIGAASDPKILAQAVAATDPDVMVLDDYALDAEALRRCCGPSRLRIVAIDDLADRPIRCELLVDPGYGRASADYAGRVPPDCRLLLGPSYALLRSGFAAGGRQGRRPAVERVFVSLGLSDIEGVAARVVSRLRDLSPAVRIDVTLAADAASLGPLSARAKADPRLTLHVDARDVAALMRAADVAVGAGGASTWERCALGLPSLAVIVADNQRRVVRALEADGVLLACDLHAPSFARDFDAAWLALQSAGLRTGLAERASALCDGEGAARVAEAILRL